MEAEDKIIMGLGIAVFGVVLFFSVPTLGILLMIFGAYLAIRGLIGALPVKQTIEWLRYFLRRVR